MKSPSARKTPRAVTFAAVLREIRHFLRERRKELARVDFVVGVSRGGLVPAALVATALDKPLVAAYIDRRDRVYLDRGAWLKGKRLLLVDDIVRSGKTMRKMLALLHACAPASVASFSPYALKGASVRPTWTRLVARDLALPWD